MEKNEKNVFSSNFIEALKKSESNNDSKDGLLIGEVTRKESVVRGKSDSLQKITSELRANSIKKQSKKPVFNFYINMKKALDKHLIKGGEDQLKTNTDNLMSARNNKDSARPQGKSVRITFREKIFWTKDQIKSFQQQIKEAFTKIYLKKSNDFKVIDNYISEKNEEELFNYLTSQQFKKFYKKEINKMNLLEKLFKAGMCSLVKRLLINDSIIYSFDFMLIIKLLQDHLNNQSLDNFELTDKLKSYVFLVIDSNLYSPSIVYLLAYMCSIFGFCKEFSILVKREAECFEDDLETFDNFETDESILNFCKNKLCFNTVIGTCISNNWEDVAITIFKTQNTAIEQDIVEMAINQQKFEFLQYVWEHLNKSFEKDLSNIQVGSSTEKFSLAEMMDRKISLFNYDTYILFKVSAIINSRKGKISRPNICKMLKWKYLENDRQLIDTLMKHKFYEEILILLNDNRDLNWTFKPEYFVDLLESNDCLLIPYFLQYVDLKKYINKSETQKQIVEKYIKYGNKIYYGAEMLSQVYKNSWNQDNTILLCKYIQKNLKLKDILNCHSPILTCTLLCEFLQGISSVSIHYSTKIDKIVKELLDFCEIIQNTTNDENYIRFLMEQRSVFGRTALHIIADNNYYKCLKNHNVGTIVGKMWNGQIPYNSLFSASSLERYLKKSVTKEVSPFLNFDPIDPNKNYLFQLSVWQNSCSLRHLPEALLTLGLIINFSVFTYQISDFFRFKKDVEDIHKFQIYQPNYIIFFVQIACININIIYQLVFSIFTDRKANLTIINYLEFILLILSSLVFINFGSMGLVTQSEENTMISVLLSLITVGVWVRILGILFTSKGLGPLIRMIYLMSLLLIKYILIYIFFIICMSAVFTSVFFHSSIESSDYFGDFITSLINLITPFVSNFNTYAFENNKLLGSVMIMIYTALTAILLMNLLIAILSSVYDELYSQVDSAHRCALIKFHKNLEWSEEYGYMIFLPNPLNIFNLLILPFQILNGTKDKEVQKKFNRFICKLYFGLLYTPFILLIFGIYTTCLIPICYIKSIVLLTKSFFNSNKNSQILPQILKSILLGIFYLIFFNLRDIYYIIVHQFNEIQLAPSEIDRIKNFITIEDIIIFLDFIHSQSKTKISTLAHVFEEYLEYEKSATLIKNEELKEKSDYLIKLNKLSDTRNVSILSFIKDTEKKQSVIKKNLIIIEILENFVDESLDELFVDIEKMKLLLPRGFEINEEYIKMLIYTNIQLINLAVMKLKSNKNSFLQYQLINKIMNKCIKVDKEIDYEIHKNLIFQKSSEQYKSDNYQGQTEINLLSRMYKFFDFFSAYFQNKCTEKEKRFNRNEQKLRLKPISSKVLSSGKASNDML